MNCTFLPFWLVGAWTKKTGQSLSKGLKEGDPAWNLNSGCVYLGFVQSEVRWLAKCGSCHSKFVQARNRILSCMKENRFLVPGFLPYPRKTEKDLLYMRTLSAYPILELCLHSSSCVEVDGVILLQASPSSLAHDALFSYFDESTHILGPVFLPDRKRWVGNGTKAPSFWEHRTYLVQFSFSEIDA